MTDIHAAEAPAEPVPPAPPEAAPAPPPAQPEVAAATAPEVESDDNRTARERILDHLADTEEPQSVQQFVDATGLSRNTIEQAIFRATKAEQIGRLAPGVYRLALPKPPPPPKPEKPAPAVGGRTHEKWMAHFEAGYAAPSTWNVPTPGPPPRPPR